MNDSKSKPCKKFVVEIRDFDENVLNNAERIEEFLKNYIYCSDLNVKLIPDNNKVVCDFKDKQFTIKFNHFVVQLIFNHEGFILDVFDISEGEENLKPLKSLYQFWNELIKLNSN